MTTQEPPFSMPLTGSQKPPVLVIETTSPSEVPWVFKKVAYKTTVKAD